MRRTRGRATCPSRAAAGLLARRPATARCRRRRLCRQLLVWPPATRGGRADVMLGRSVCVCVCVLEGATPRLHVNAGGSPAAAGSGRMAAAAVADDSRTGPWTGLRTRGGATVHSYSMWPTRRMVVCTLAPHAATATATRARSASGGVPLSSADRHVGRIYRLAVQSVAKMGIQGGFTGLQDHFYWGLLYKDLQNLASRSVAKNTL